MAKKRLNKKIALIGSIAVLVILVGLLYVIVQLSRDPDKFITDGDAALQLARDETDEEAKEESLRLAQSRISRSTAPPSTASDDPLPRRPIPCSKRQLQTAY